MITAISNSTQATKVAFQGNPLSLVKGELGGNVSKIGEGVADSFSKSISKIVGKDEMPFTKEVLTAADHYKGQIVVDSLGNAIEDPSMPGTVIHELAKGDHGFIDDPEESLGIIGSIFKAIFDID